MVARAGLESSYSSDSVSCALDLPHSPHSRESSPPHQGHEASLEGTSSEQQIKGNLLDWLRIKMRKEFQSLLQEQRAHPKSLGKPA